MTEYIYIYVYQYMPIYSYTEKYINSRIFVQNEYFWNFQNCEIRNVNSKVQYQQSIMLYHYASKGIHYLLVVCNGPLSKQFYLIGTENTFLQLPFPLVLSHLVSVQWKVLWQLEFCTLMITLDPWKHSLKSAYHSRTIKIIS